MRTAAVAGALPRAVRRAVGVDLIGNVARPAGLEPAASSLGNRRSILMSYGRQPRPPYSGNRAAGKAPMDRFQGGFCRGYFL